MSKEVAGAMVGFGAHRSEWSFHIIGQTCSLRRCKHKKLSTKKGLLAFDIGSPCRRTARPRSSVGISSPSGHPFLHKQEHFFACVGGQHTCTVAALANSKGQESGVTEEEQEQQSSKLLKEFLRGGQDVADVIAQMANLLEDIQGFEEREEALAVEMAAAAAVAGRIEILDRNFLLAVDFMTDKALKAQDSQQVWLLQTLKQQVLFQLESRFPPQLEVVAMLVATSEKDGRHAILRKAVAAAAIGANQNPTEEKLDSAVATPNVVSQTSGGTTTDESSDSRAAELSVPEEQIAPEDDRDAASPTVNEDVQHTTVNASRPVRPWPDAKGQNKQLADTGAAAVWVEDRASDEKPKEIDDGSGRVYRRVPAAPLEHIIAQADDLIGFMEEDLPIRDRRLLARLVLAREEARGMLGGGYEDSRGDVRKFQNLPEAEVRYMSQLTAIRDQSTVKQKIMDVMMGKEEGEYKDGSPQDMPFGAPVRPGHFMDSVTKVIVGVYKTGGSGFIVQQLESIRKTTLQVLQEVGYGK